MNTIYLKKLISKNYAIQLIANAAYSASTVRLSLLAMAALLVSACSSNSSSSGVIEEQPETFTIFTADETSKMETIIINGAEYHPVAIFDSSYVSLPQSSDSLIVKDSVLYTNDLTLIGDGKAIFTSMNDLNFKLNGKPFSPELIVDTVSISAKEVQGSELPGIKISADGDLEVKLQKGFLSLIGDDDKNKELKELKDSLAKNLESTYLDESLSNLLVDEIISQLEDLKEDSTAGGQQTYEISIPLIQLMDFPYTYFSILVLDLMSAKDSLKISCEGDDLIINDGSHQLLSYNHTSKALNLDLKSTYSNDIDFNDLTLRGFTPDDVDPDGSFYVDIQPRSDECDANPSSVSILVDHDGVEFNMLMLDGAGVAKYFDKLFMDSTFKSLFDNEFIETFFNYFADGNYFFYDYDITAKPTDINLKSDGSGFTIGSQDFIYPLLSELKTSEGYKFEDYDTVDYHELQKFELLVNTIPQDIDIDTGNELAYIFPIADALGFPLPKLIVFKEDDGSIQNDSYTYGLSQTFNQEYLEEFESILSSANATLKHADVKITTLSNDLIDSYNVTNTDVSYTNDEIRLQMIDYDHYDNEENNFSELYSNSFAALEIFSGEV